MHSPQKDMMWLLSACTNFLVTASSIICFTWETKVDGKSLSFVWCCCLRWQKAKTRNALRDQEGWVEYHAKGAVQPHDTCQEDSKHTKLFISCANTDATLSSCFRTSVTGFLLSDFFWIKFFFENTKALTFVEHTYLFKCCSINLNTANVKIRKLKSDIRWKIRAADTKISWLMGSQW